MASQGGDGLGHHGEAERVDGVADLGAAAPGADQACLAQDLEVLADGRLRDPEHLGEIARAGLRLGRETPHDAQPDRVPERSHGRGRGQEGGIIKRRVNVHDPSIARRKYRE